MQGYITDEEASQMLLELGYARGSGGGGSYTPPSGGSPSVQMTK